MRAFLINPTDRTISTLDHSGKLEDMYKSIQCETVDRVGLTPDLDMWVDDEGHISVGKNIFELSGSAQRYAGNGLVLGHDDEGNSSPAEITIQRLLELVRWTELASSGEIGEGHSIGAVIYGGEPIAQLRAPDSYVVWSNEHARWWAPGSSGYVATLKEAGRYSRQHALQICKDARGGWNGQSPPPEIPVRTIDAIAAGLEGRYL